jgi:hypothetical protein
MVNDSSFTHEFTDEESGEAGVLIVRQYEGGAWLTVSMRAGEEIEITLPPGIARSFAAVLKRSADPGGA